MAVAFLPTILNAALKNPTHARMTVADAPCIEGPPRILLICARPSLGSVHAGALRELLQQPVDWDGVLRGARRNFMAVLLRQHLQKHAADLMPPAVVQALDQMRRQNALKALEIARIERLLVDEILSPAQVRHVFFKGAGLSAQYYGGRYIRQYRDIDVLIDPAKLVAVGEALIRRGYRIYNHEWEKFHVKDVAAFCQYNSALELCSPTGVILELHRMLDNSGCVFATRDVLDRAHTTSIGDQQLQTLPCADLFVYICFHHSRHLWSSLHWCADLEALTAHPDFNDSHVKSLASRLGLTATVEESLQLRADLERLALDGCLASFAGASRFLPDCLAALRKSTLPVAEGATGAPEERHREPDFLHDWQKTLGYRWRFLMSRLHPSANDFNAWPLPARWRWLYYLLKPLRVLKSRWQPASR